MGLEEKILELYNKEYKSIKTKKIINLLKVVLVDGENNLYSIEKKVPITVATIKKYIKEKESFTKFISEEEYNLLYKKIENILELEKTKYQRNRNARRWNQSISYW